MLAGDIEIVGQDLTSVEVQDITDCLDENNVRILCVRGCTVSDGDFQRLMHSVKTCQSLLQLNCALGVVNTPLRVELLTQALIGNHSLRDIFLHSNAIGDEGAKLICGALYNHPRVVSLDVGDCNIGDIGLEAICMLLPSNGPKLGLQDLVLSSNPKVSSMGWARFAVALSSCASLRSLQVDYNNLGDYGVGCLAMFVASSKHLEHLDLECTQLTQHSADLLLHLVRNYPVQLRKLVLVGNEIHPSTLEAIHMCLDDLRGGKLDAMKVALHKEANHRKVRDVQTGKGDKKVKAIKQLSALMAEDCSSVSNFLDDPHSAESAQEEIIMAVHKNPKLKLAFDETSVDEKGDNRPQHRKVKSRGKKENRSKCEKGKSLAVTGDAEKGESPTEDYEEMTEIPFHEIQQPSMQAWISITKPV